MSKDVWSNLISWIISLSYWKVDNLRSLLYSNHVQKVEFEICFETQFLILFVNFTVISFLCLSIGWRRNSPSFFIVCGCYGPYYKCWNSALYFVDLYFRDCRSWVSKGWEYSEIGLMRDMEVLKGGFDLEPHTDIQNFLRIFRCFKILIETCPRCLENLNSVFV